MRHALVVLSFLLTACSSVSQKPSAEAVRDLAPSGTPEPSGISVDLARELGKRLGVPVQLIVFDAAGKVVDAGRSGAWDIAFVALDPKRAAEINQSPPYVQIEGSYLVRNDSPLKSNDEVDRKGHRVVVGRNSAYDLYLSRELKQAELVRTPTSNLVVDTMLKENYEVSAGVKQALMNDAQRIPGVRLLPGRFMVINQAMASQKGKEAGAKYLREFVEEMKSSGFVAKAIERHQQPSAVVAPPGDPK